MFIPVVTDAYRTYVNTDFVAAMKVELCEGSTGMIFGVYAYMPSLDRFTLFVGREDDCRQRLSEYMLELGPTWQWGSKGILVNLAYMAILVVRPYEGRWAVLACQSIDEVGIHVMTIGSLDHCDSYVKYAGAAWCLKGAK